MTDVLEIAVKMYHREHDRWYQWALFYLGSIASVFVVWGHIEKDVPLIIPCVFGFILSAFWVLASLDIRASTNAWRETITALQGGGIGGEISALELFGEKLEEFGRLADLLRTLNLTNGEVWKSVTRKLTLLGVIYAVAFVVLGFLSLK